MGTAETVGLTTGKEETTLEEMLNTIADSLHNLASSHPEEGWQAEEADEEDTELRKLSEDDEPSWVMGTFPQSIQHHMERFQQK